MEKLFLRVFFSGEELYVIDQQRIQRPVIALKFVNGVVLQSFDHVRDKTFLVNVDDFRILFTLRNQVACGLHEVGFA